MCAEGHLLRELWLVSAAAYASGQLSKYTVPRSSAEHHYTQQHGRKAECVAAGTSHRHATYPSSFAAAATAGTGAEARDLSCDG